MTTTNNTLSPDQDEVAKLKAQLESIEKENAALKAGGTRRDTHAVGPDGLGIKVSEAKAASVYGIGRFPGTFYPESWRKLARAMPDIIAWLDAEEAKGSFGTVEEIAAAKAANKVKREEERAKADAAKASQTAAT